MKPLSAFFLLLTMILPSTVFGTLPGLSDVGNGEVRYLGIFKVYDANLFTQPEATQENILLSNTSRCLVLNYSTSLSAEDLIKGGEVVLARQHSKEKIDNLRKYIDQLHESYTDIRSGDSYSLCYDSSSSITTLSYNSEEVVAIKSSEFAEIYFGIWLGAKDPIDDSLRDNLLKKLPSQ